MKLKTVELNGKTYAEISNGNPVYVHDDGKEAGFDATATLGTIKNLNREAQTHREAKEVALSKLAAFDGISDPAAALAAINKIKDIDDKTLMDAGKAEEMKAAAIAAVKKEFDPVVAENDELKKALSMEKIGGSFSRSKFIAEKIAVPSDMVESQFGRNFSIDAGKLVAKDANGNQIYSKVNPGEAAGFDEALEIMVDQYPHKENILKGANNSGSGSTGSNSGGNTGNKTMTRAQYDALDHSARRAKMGEGYKLTE